MSFFKWFQRNKEDDLSEYRSSHMTATSDFEEAPDFGYCFEQLLSNGSLIFTITDCDSENCGYIVCNSQGNVTVLFDERWSYGSSDVKYLTEQVKKFYTAFNS